MVKNSEIWNGGNVWFWQGSRLACHLISVNTNRNPMRLKTFLLSSHFENLEFVFSLART